MASAVDPNLRAFLEFQYAASEFAGLFGDVIDHKHHVRWNLDKVEGFKIVHDFCLAHGKVAHVTVKNYGISRSLLQQGLMAAGGPDQVRIGWHFICHRPKRRHQRREDYTTPDNSHDFPQSLLSDLGVLSNVLQVRLWA